jgi:hypothetical protein
LAHLQAAHPLFALEHAMPNPLREAVKQRFYPFAESRGFARIKSTNSLFTEFRKDTGEATYVFEIQWDKYHRPYFVLNFSQAEATLVGSRTKQGRLQRKRGGSLSCWFNLRKPLREVIKTGRLKYAPEEVVEQVISCFPEMEAWWASGAEGPHVYCI